MNRNIDIEKRIHLRRSQLGRGANPYGGMGMDGDSPLVIKEKQEEIVYMKQHPEIYTTPKKAPNAMKFTGQTE